MHTDSNSSPLFFLIQPITVTFAKTALSATDQPQVFKTIAAGAMLASSATLTIDGTKEWFGVDDPRLLAMLFAGHFFILSLWLGQYGDATEDDDAEFFGEIDYTGC
jgi:hypothetical protein